jgi:lysine-specific demethylase/histidyl-hydroxylase NO66
VTTQATPPTSATPALSSEALGLTLDPFEPERFFDEYWEQRPLLVARGEDARFHSLLAPADVERLVCETGLRVPAFRLVKEGAQLPLSTYTEDIRWRPGSFSGTAVVERVADEFARGATLVLQALQLYWPAAALYCRDLEKLLGCPVQANAYHTPAAARGFAVHHDTHDVFILQVAGRKRWRVYEPVLELPLKDQRWSPELGDPGEAIQDFVLEAGDTLYLPRGWPHEATTSEDESLHLTIGIHPQTRLEALRSALESCAEEDVEFRRSADGDVPDELLERFAARLDSEELARRLRRRFVAGRRPILHDQLTQLRALERLTVDSELERRPTVIFELEEAADGRALLLFEGKELHFPPQATEAVRALAAEPEGPVSAAALPGALDEPGRLVLVRRLVREGFLRLAG